MTVAGAVANGGVAEVVIGASLSAVVEAYDPVLEPAMVLAGGYFGGWIPWRSCPGLTASILRPLHAVGAGLGAGNPDRAPEAPA